MDVTRTFLDGSRVVLRRDGEVVATPWAWARNGGKETLSFPLTIDRPGKHTLEIANQTVVLEVTP